MKETGGETLQDSADARQKDNALTQHLFHVSLSRLIYQFLAHTLDIKRGKLTDKLVREGILSVSDKQAIKKYKKTADKVMSLLMALKQNSASEFNRFLKTLYEMGQKSVADTVHQAVHSVGLQEENPLQYYICGKTACLRLHASCVLFASKLVAATF